MEKSPALMPLVLFFSTFVTVFAMGLQSLNVNGGHYKAAFINSVIIGGSNLLLYKVMPNANPADIIAYLSGGPFGIVSSMYFHKRTIGRKKPEKE